MMTPERFLAEVVAPALTALDLDGPAARELLLGTALQESRLRNIPQAGGPALGYFQMEPATHDDIWENFLAYRPDLAARVTALLPDGAPLPSDLLSYPLYAAAMARLLYARVAAPLPAAGDIAAQAAYYKRWYNTPEGAATVEAYLGNWRSAMGEGACAPGSPVC